MCIQQCVVIQVQVVVVGQVDFVDLCVVGVYCFVYVELVIVEGYFDVMCFQVVVDLQVVLFELEVLGVEDFVLVQVLV